MRKIILKKKKKIRVCRPRKAALRMLSAAAALCLLAGEALPAQGSEKGRESALTLQETVTEIYHMHTGSRDEQGGCYNAAVAHKHQGDEASGGTCFQIPVYHSHQGNESGQGGCYVTPVMHEHQGNELQGGACYEEITHTHTAECYEQADCLMTHAPDGNILETLTDMCFAHGQVTFGRSKGIATHNDCGKGQEERTYKYCLTCGTVSPSIHSYQKLICSISEETVTGYERICGKDEETVERYAPGCGLEDQEIEGYRQSCHKEVEEYALDCGFSENQLCGRLILKNETLQQAEEAVISARLEDLTGGKLKLKVPPYEWRDESGKVIGSGEKITVNENGNYFVTCQLENQDVKEAKLHGSITVSNICKASPSESPTPQASASASESPTPQASTSPSESPAPQASASPEVSPTPTQTPAASSSEDGNGSSSGQEESGGGEEAVILAPWLPMVPEAAESADEEVIQPVPRTKKAFVQEKISLPQQQETAPVVKESQRVEMEEYEAPGETVTVKEEKRHGGFFELSAVKIISVAGSVLALIFAMLLLLFYLRRSVKVLNDDGEGRMIYLGRCMVNTEDDCYRIEIKQTLEEKACTNRYCIRPGLFRLGKKEGEELVIVKGSKSAAVCIDKEMIVML